MMNKEEYLQKVLKTHKMSHVNELLKKYMKKRQEIKECLEQEYGKSIYNPMNSGSYAKHTAINIKFDLDIVIPFKRNSFATLEEMFENIYNFLSETYSDVATVRKQKVSIGIIFDEDKDGDVINIDVVPGREFNDNQYIEDKKLNLYVNSEYGQIQKSKYIQTNIQAQIDHIKGKNNERSIIRLLKIWKNSNNEPYKSFFLELITIRAFNKKNITGNLWEKLRSVIEYIRDNVANDGFTLKDPGNSSNNVADTLKSWEKEALKNKMELMISNIENNTEAIKVYFPINENFEEEDKYGLKDFKIAPSIPSKSQQFG
ncbi:nucleotidyltransferase [Riemerella anatipestifer]|uniref:Nucleotidyltransferase n=1 Tax=Riemerella anatipestifer TaxID=34085 RepID=A0AAP3ANU4_RIEAN|nr:nucleotidyltransferase [Riemerella anatipestifer]MCO7318935.1 nucleotidyltransferase [Riemerella anatipestifer]MCQ4155220.1 nucleotidyltransferase [Riemerella anatipestifer]MCQ4181171.1 nucleotidyltransferase [Riemerella anatipestifer]MCU7568453.1 nucleotidyltransferase [Riemerella anatipestifer]MCW0474414.1 nucleotidyltransferase [Riemerella anatipestifer]